MIEVGQMEHEQAVARVDSLRVAAARAPNLPSSTVEAIVATLLETQGARGPWYDTAYVVIGRLAEMGLLRQS